MNSPYKKKFKVTQIFKGSTHDGLDLVGLDSKEIYSTVNGVVERAGWENSENKKQGFGLYVRIKQNGSNDRYYFGHLSKLKVKVGQAVNIGDNIGTEGNTGRSTGSHCHYCIRGNCSKEQIRDVCAISGIENKLGTYVSAEAQVKDVAVLAKEVIAGKWGNGTDRKKRLTSAGYDFSAVQAEVNRILSGTGTSKKSVEEMAKEVIAGKWGNGAERKSKITNAGYDYSEIQKAVNQLLKK